MTKLSTKAQKVLGFLARGGYFSHKLETNSYTRRDQFQTRLYSADGYVLKGYGFVVCEELKDAGAIGYIETAESSVWETRYVITNAGKALAAEMGYLVGESA